MAYNHTLSAILRGQWLIENSYANAHLPLVASMLQGKPVSWGMEKEVAPVSIIKAATKTSAVHYSIGPESAVGEITTDFIAHIKMAGPILKYGDMCSYGAEDYTALINNLAARDNCQGVLLHIDGPGGQASGIASLGQAINNCSRSKPILAVVNDGMAASAHMWIASQCDEIYCTQSTDMVGSIGAYITIADWNKQLKELHKLDVTDVYAPQSSDKNKVYTDALEGNDKALKQELKVLVDGFISAVEDGRGGRLTSDEWNTGKMYHAKDALRIGLIDGIQPLTKVFARLADLVSINETEKEEAEASNNSNPKLNTMAFEKTMAAAAATEFAVVDGGFLLTEENLNSLETAFATSETNTALVATQATELQTLQTALQENQTALATANTRITALQDEVKTLGAADSGDGTTVVTEKDQTAGTKKLPSYLDPNSEINKAAAQTLRRHGIA